MFLAYGIRWNTAGATFKSILSLRKRNFTIQFAEWIYKEE
uniref:Predicted gene 20449 n=1 Tax=Mus musculus TaxID=10090 RepID=E9Q3U2_MOUSE